LGGAEYYGYRDDLKAEVVASLTRFGLEPMEHGVHLVQGLFEDTIHPDGPVAFAHIDGDWYESVRVCLERIWPHLVVGGVLVIDDYEHWSGCRTAVDEFLGERSGWRTEKHARLHIVKTA
jgi:asparagine synthase (glutamine-hydrolysing)